MAVSDKDIKILWGRAAGKCSHPNCGADLTKEATKGSDYIIGEMAHVIAHSEGGPRGKSGGGDDTYENLILLCPNHHREIDKAPEGEFSPEVLLGWKQAHETKVRSIGESERFASAEELAAAVRILLAENRAIWESLGPLSEVAQRNPDSNAHRIWELRRVDRIVPNNRKILNMIRANYQLLRNDQVQPFAAFANHAEANEAHVYERLDEYPLFPQEFSEVFR